MVDGFQKLQMDAGPVKAVPWQPLAAMRRRRRIGCTPQPQPHRSASAASGQ